jgi:hypothetical protein
VTGFSQQDRPDGPELLEALARYLISELAPSVAREQRFNVRIAANACAILAREWEHGHSAERREAVRAELAVLAAAIRAGERDDRWDETVAALRESVAGKLAVAHPGYDAVADDGRK